MTFKQRIEKNSEIWFLGALVGAFGAGIGAYQGILAISGRTSVAVEKLEELASARAAEARPICEKHGAKIVAQAQVVSEAAQVVVLAGSADPLPSGYQLWVAAVGPAGSREYWPRDEAKASARSWTLEVRPGLRSADDQKRYALLVVGPNGQILIDQYRNALRGLPADAEWPPLTDMTSDMVRCPGVHEVALRQESL